MSVARRAAFVLLVAGCAPDGPTQVAVQATGGDPNRAPELIRKYGCGACHMLSGVTGAHGLVGPPLDGVGRRQILAGRLPNTPDNLVRWIRDPQSVDPQTAMPNMGVSEPEARHIAAYLYSKR